MIVLLGINDGLDEGSGLFSFFLEYGNDDVHDFGDQRGETRENLVYDTLSHLFKHEVHVLQEVKGGLSQFFHLRLNEVDKDIH